MGIKLYKPTSPGRRISSVDDFADITKSTPEKKLTIARKEKAGRNFQGKITIRHRGSGVKQRIRLVDFSQTQFLDMDAKVLTIEYDPNRTARIALIQYKNGVKTYILAPAGLAVGSIVISSKKKIEPNVGSRMPLEFIPAGMFVCNLELLPGRGGKVVRSAGTLAQIMGTEGKYTQVKLPSSEIRLFPKECLATIGQVSNIDNFNIRWGKAGRMRNKGWRPTVRGKVMNPVDHPHGGGEGNNPIGLVHPKTPWGKAALGVKTRKKKNASNKFIIQRRKK